MATLTPYIPEWARPDSPTRTMTEAEARAYYKAHQVRGDCRFALWPGATAPADLRDGWRALLTLVEARGRELASDRRLVEQLRRAWRGWASGRPYVVPSIPDPPQKVKGENWKARALAAEARVRELEGHEWVATEAQDVADRIREELT